jgi:manganese/zinc/iron transport system permease protein
MLAAFFNNIPLMIMLTGALVGVAASLVGAFLVLRGSSLLSDAISHSIVFGIIIVWLLTGQQSGLFQIIGAALTGLLTVVLTELLTKTRLVRNDAAIGLVFPALFAAGVLLINVYARNVHIDQHTVLLGEIGFVWLDTVNLGAYRVPQALLSMGALTLLNLAFVTLLFKELKLSVFDPALARALGFAPGVLFYALLALTSGTAVAAFDAVGAVLFIAFVIVPPSAAYLLTDRLSLMLVYGSLIAIISSVAGYWLAVVWNVSIGGMMASVTGLFLLLAFLLGPRYGLLAQQIRRSTQQAANLNRMLVVHLHNHEGQRERSDASDVNTLGEHLGWPEARVRAVTASSLNRNLVTLKPGNGGTLQLTEEGRRLAREVLEPWRHANGE